MALIIKQYPTNHNHFIRFHEITNTVLIGDIDGEGIEYENCITPNKSGGIGNSYLTKVFGEYRPTLFNLTFTAFAWNPDRDLGLSDSTLRLHLYNVDTLTDEASFALNLTGIASNRKFWQYFDQAISVIAGTYRFVVVGDGDEIRLVSNEIEILNEETDTDEYTFLYWGTSGFDVLNFDYEEINENFNPDVDVADDIGDFFVNALWLKVYQVANSGLDTQDRYEDERYIPEVFNGDVYPTITLEGFYFDERSHRAMASLAKQDNIYIMGIPVTMQSGWETDTTKYKDRALGTGEFVIETRSRRVVDAYGWDEDIRSIQATFAWSGIRNLQTIYSGTEYYRSLSGVNTDGDLTPFDNSLSYLVNQGEMDGVVGKIHDSAATQIGVPFIRNNKFVVNENRTVTTWGFAEKEYEGFCFALSLSVPTIPVGGSTIAFVIGGLYKSFGAPESFSFNIRLFGNDVIVQTIYEGTVESQEVIISNYSTSQTYNIVINVDFINTVVNTYIDRVLTPIPIILSSNKLERVSIGNSSGGVTPTFEYEIQEALWLEEFLNEAQVDSLFDLLESY